jgi:hypothetical protein
VVKKSAPAIAPQCARRNICHDVGRCGTGGRPWAFKIRAIVDRRFHRLRQPKVQDLDLAVARHRNICWLEIAMDDAFLVGRFESLRDLSRNRERFIDGDLSSRDSAVQALAVHQFEHEELLTVGLVQTVDRANMRVIERGQDLRFTAKPRDSFEIVGE